jgi:hypothetical protein
MWREVGRGGECEERWREWRGGESWREVGVERGGENWRCRELRREVV